MNEKPILISVCMVTYNHEKYIEDAIKGVLMQQTSFSIELIISEDGGTDKTRSLVQKYANDYPNIIVVDLPDYNRGIIRNFCFNLSLARGKYIALCEGDDYWIDPLKLQKQVDFLESHENYGMTYTKAKTINEEKGTTLLLGEEVKDFRSLLLLGNKIPTLTVCFKKSLFDNYMQTFEQSSISRWKMGDYPIWLFFFLKTQVKFLDDVTSVYRIISESASHSKNIDKQISFSNSVYDIRHYFLTNFYIGNDSSEIEYQIQEECLWEHFRYNIIYENVDKALEVLYVNKMQISFIRRCIGLLIIHFSPFRRLLKKKWSNQL